MLTPDAARVRLLALATPVDIERLPLASAAGRWAAEPLAALRTQPARDLSAMDGYAIRHADAAGPWRVIGESAAGSPFSGSVAAGEAVRIFTGAALPHGTDSVVIQENVARSGDGFTLTGDAPERCAHVRPAGSDFTEGQRLVDAGDLLIPARIGIAAMAGHAVLAVRRRIRVAILSTGDELVPPGSDAGTDRLPASNGVMLAAMLADLPVDIIDLGIIGDDRAALSAAFARAADVDVIVSTGGASVGDHDLIRPALIDAGAVIDFWRIAMRPGKPLLAGRLRAAVILGLPGNPVSAFVTATLFLKPLIAHLSGARDAAPPVISARLARAMPVVGVRTDYVRAHWQAGRIAPIDGDSAMLAPLTAATALIIRPAEALAAAVDTLVDVVQLA